MATYYSIPLEEMDEVLRGYRFAPVDLTYRNRPIKEWVYERRLPRSPNHFVRVYTGVQRYGRDAGHSRKVGKDAIRVQVVYRDEKGETLVSQPKRVHRVDGWRENLQKRMNEISSKLPQVEFDARGEPMTLRKHKGNYFWGSRDYPKYKETKSFAVEEGEWYGIPIHEINSPAEYQEAFANPALLDTHLLRINYSGVYGIRRIHGPSKVIYGQNMLSSNAVPAMKADQSYLSPVFTEMLERSNQWSHWKNYFGVQSAFGPFTLPQDREDVFKRIERDLSFQKRRYYGDSPYGEEYESNTIIFDLEGVVFAMEREELGTERGYSWGAEIEIQGGVPQSNIIYQTLEPEMVKPEEVKNPVLFRQSPYETYALEEEEEEEFVIEVPDEEILRDDDTSEELWPNGFFEEFCDSDYAITMEEMRNAMEEVASTPLGAGVSDIDVEWRDGTEAGLGLGAAWEYVDWSNPRNFPLWTIFYNKGGYPMASKPTWEKMLQKTQNIVDWECMQMNYRGEETKETLLKDAIIALSRLQPYQISFRGILAEEVSRDGDGTGLSAYCENFSVLVVMNGWAMSEVLDRLQDIPDIVWESDLEADEETSYSWVVESIENIYMRAIFSSYDSFTNDFTTTVGRFAPYGPISSYNYPDFTPIWGRSEDIIDGSRVTIEEESSPPANIVTYVFDYMMQPLRPDGEGNVGMSEGEFPLWNNLKLIDYTFPFMLMRPISGHLILEDYDDEYNESVRDAIEGRTTASWIGGLMTEYGSELSVNEKANHLIGYFAAESPEWEDEVDWEDSEDIEQEPDWEVDWDAEEITLKEFDDTDIGPNRIFKTLQDKITFMLRKTSKINRHGDIGCPVCGSIGMFYSEPISKGRKWHCFNCLYEDKMESIKSRGDITLEKYGLLIECPICEKPIKAYNQDSMNRHMKKCKEA